MTSMIQDNRYPVGRFKYEGDPSREAIDASIAEIESLPQRLRESIVDLDEAQMNTPYREGGWTPHLVVHHVADSHMNAYVRCKLALTEDSPTIKPYDEALWANLADVKALPVDVSLSLIDTLHKRWVALLRAMPDADFERGYVHPDHNRTVPLREVVALYAWHGRHHTAHITALRERNGWS
jgi:uncharacterized damage-inducible protein DinB